MPVLLSRKRRRLSASLGHKPRWRPGWTSISGLASARALLLHVELPICFIPPPLTHGKQHGTRPHYAGHHGIPHLTSPLQLATQPSAYGFCHKVEEGEWESEVHVSSQKHRVLQQEGSGGQEVNGHAAKSEAEPDQELGVPDSYHPCTDHPYLRKCKRAPQNTGLSKGPFLGEARNPAPQDYDLSHTDEG